MLSALRRPVPALNFKVNTFTGKRYSATVASIAALIALPGLAAVAQTPRPGSPARDAASASAFRSQTTAPVSPLGPGPLMFLPAVDYGSGDFRALSAALADVNGDGKPDLVVTNGNANSVGVLLGNGDGTFQTAVTYDSGPSDPMGVVIADVNGDGKPDVLVVNFCSSSCANGSVAVLLGNGDGTFKAAVSYSSGGYASESIAVADVNGDGKPDVVVTNWCFQNTCTSQGTVAVLLGNGDGTFKAAATHVTGGAYAYSVAIADVNHDSKLDLVVANACQTTGICNTGGDAAVLLGNGDGTFQSAVAYGSGGYEAYFISVADVNDDGNPDLLVGNLCSGNNFSSCPGADAPTDATVGVLLGNGDGTFQPVAAYDSGGETVHAVVAADVNGDGKVDLIVGNSCGDSTCEDSTLSVLAGNGDGTFQPAVVYDLGGYEVYSVLVADLNGDGKPDLIAAIPCVTSSCAGNGEVGVLLNNYGTPTTSTSLASSVNPVSVKKAVTYTATVGHSGGALGGAVTFADGAVPLATVALTNNQATFSTSYSSGGSHAITASYSGILNVAEGSRSDTLAEYATVATKTVVSTSGSPSMVGQPVTFTATVTSTHGVIPDGEQVNFYQGTTLLGSASLSGEKATFTTSALSAKTKSVKATYVGDDTFSPSSGLVAQIVELYSTTTTLVSSPNPSQSGHTVTFTATVQSSGPETPTGKVTFRDGMTSIGTATLSGGVGTFKKANFAAGTHSITATYDGDPMSAGSASAALSQVVQ
jgi:Bacterial Ig-like domain (group 3)/FG-GAP-like repeat